VPIEEEEEEIRNKGCLYEYSNNVSIHCKLFYAS
jgi:hypothetical protein